jgi:hypothetical protein
MRPQYDAVRAISISLAGPPPMPAPVPTTLPEVLKLQADVAELRANQAKTDAALEAQAAKVRAAGELLK